MGSTPPLSWCSPSCEDWCRKSNGFALGPRDSGKTEEEFIGAPVDLSTLVTSPILKNSGRVSCNTNSALPNQEFPEISVV